VAHIAAAAAEAPIAEARPLAAVEAAEARAGTAVVGEGAEAARSAAAHKLPDDTPALAAAMPVEAVAEAGRAIPEARAVAVAMPVGVAAAGTIHAEARLAVRPAAEEAPPGLLLSLARRRTDILSSTAEHLSRIAGIPN
jgi:hypothetical protein